jgi:transcriptional regulator with XRE-family HTH domain
MAAHGSADAEAQTAFSAGVAALLRESRIRQGLTQAQVSARTGGLVSKAALANYETGHRSVRVDVFWLLVRALGEDAGVMLAGAERRSGYGRSTEALTALTVDIAAVQASTDPRLIPVQRWFAVRLQPGPGRPSVRTVTLDDGALAALASLMAVSPGECRALLMAASGAGEIGVPDSSTRSADLESVEETGSSEPASDAPQLFSGGHPGQQVNGRGSTDDGSEQEGLRGIPGDPSEGGRPGRGTSVLGSLAAGKGPTKGLGRRVASRGAAAFAAAHGAGVGVEVGAARGAVAGPLADPGPLRDVAVGS